MSKRTAGRTCPSCGCGQSRAVKPTSGVAFQNDRQCVRCQTVYTPTTPAWGSFLCIVVGGAMVIGGFLLMTKGSTDGNSFAVRSIWIMVVGGMFVVYGFTSLAAPRPPEVLDALVESDAAADGRPSWDAADAAMDPKASAAAIARGMALALDAAGRVLAGVRDRVAELRACGRPAGLREVRELAALHDQLVEAAHRFPATAFSRTCMDAAALLRSVNLRFIAADGPGVAPDARGSAAEFAYRPEPIEPEGEGFGRRLGIFLGSAFLCLILAAVLTKPIDGILDQYYNDKDPAREPWRKAQAALILAGGPVGGLLVGRFIRRRTRRGRRAGNRPEFAALPEAGRAALGELLNDGEPAPARALRPSPTP